MLKLQKTISLNTALLLSVFLLSFGAMAKAQPQTALLLYKSSEEASPSLSRVATKIAPILQQLGFQASYLDIDKGLPPSVSADLIVSWFSTPKIANPEGYVDWLTSQVSAGRKVVILGNFGAHTSDGVTWMTNESLNRFFYPFGLSYGAAYTGQTDVLRVSQQSAPASAPAPLNYYLLFSSVNQENKVFMEVERTDLEQSKSALVVQTPYGAMAQETYVDNLDLNAFLTLVTKAKTKTTAVDKKLLGLYKSKEGVDSRTNYLARFVASTLYDLGYGIDYHDIDSGLPSAERMAAYQGVISWYLSPEMPKAADYISWLAAQMDAGRRVIILGNFGAFAEDISSAGGVVRRFLQSPEYNRFFYPFGLEFRGAWTSKKHDVRVGKKDDDVITWLDPSQVGHYFWIRSVHPDNKEYLTIVRDDLDDGESAAVVATPHGGFALESYVLSTDPKTNQPRLHIDLAKFLKSCLTLTATTQLELKPNLEGLESKPPLAVKPKPLRGGSTQYPSGVQPVKRKILAFYNSDIEEDSANNATYLNAQAPLEHLGMVVDYYDVASGKLPAMSKMDEYRGILVWLGSGVMPNAKGFDIWLQENIAAGRKTIIMSDYDLRDKATLSLVNPKNTFAALGLDYDVLGNVPIISNVKGVQKFTRAAVKQAKVVYQDPQLIGFERDIDWSDEDLKSSWQLVRSVWPESKVGLSVQRSDGISDVVVISRTGAVVLGGFPTWSKGAARRTRTETVAKKGDTAIKAEETGGNAWRIDPYRFFSEAFDIEKTPRPDVTTLNGSRIYFSHIDGDAFGGISWIDFSSLNAEIMYQRILTKIPLPITVSYVTNDIEKRLDERYSRELEVAQEIFKLPNVEPASHTFSHPFEWIKGDLAVADGAKDYTLTRLPVDLAKEILHSVEFVDKLCPPGKQCKILLWSGRCNPPPAAIEMARKLGLPNMNGGEPVLAPEFPNISGLLPLYVDRGGETQYHVSAPGDFFYTGSWTEQYDGMKNLPDFFNRTESPRRLRALNVYYHFYLAEREPGIEGLNVAYDDVLRRQPAPMFASDYVGILEDALQTQIGIDPEGRYWVHNSGLNSTIRFDHEDRYPDFSNSTGVIGFSQLNGALYLHLDGSGEARLALTTEEPSVPYLAKFTHKITGWNATKTKLRFTAAGQGPVLLELRNLIPSTSYRIKVGSIESAGQSDARGTLTWQTRFEGYEKSFPIQIEKATP